MRRTGKDKLGKTTEIENENIKVSVEYFKELLIEQNKHKKLKRRRQKEEMLAINIKTSNKKGPGVNCIFMVNI